MNAENLQRSAARAGGDRRRGVHEHHLEQEQREGRRVITRSLQQESFPAEEAEELAAEEDPNS